MNKKGQVLIVFILMLPIFLMLIGMIIDIGYNYLEKRKLDNVIKDTIVYGLEHNTEDPEVLRGKMNHLIDENISNITLSNIVIEENNVKITINKETEGLFGRILNKRLYQISSSYRGYMENAELKIIKE
jgi:Flp pilus assembly protein TadG